MLSGDLRRAWKALGDLLRGTIENRVVGAQGAFQLNGRPAFPVATSAHWLYNQRLRIIPVIVSVRHFSTINTEQFARRRNLSPSRRLMHQTMRSRH